MIRLARLHVRGWLRRVGLEVLRDPAQGSFEVREDEVVLLGARRAAATSPWRRSAS